jgi:hypothetical protein
MRNRRLVLAPNSCTLIFSSRTRSRPELSFDANIASVPRPQLITQKRELFFRVYLLDSSFLEIGCGACAPLALRGIA